MWPSFALKFSMQCWLWKQGALYVECLHTQSDFWWGNYSSPLKAIKIKLRSCFYNGLWAHMLSYMTGVTCVEAECTGIFGVAEPAKGISLFLRTYQVVASVDVFALCDRFIMAFQPNDGFPHLHWHLFGPHIKYKVQHCHEIPGEQTSPGNETARPLSKYIRASVDCV